jgi:hypothetical protein
MPMGRHFRNFREVYPVKNRVWAGKEQIHILRGTNPSLTYPAWRNIKYQHGRGKKSSGTNRGLFHSHNCNFPRDSFILISFCFKVAGTHSHTPTKRGGGGYLLYWWFEMDGCQLEERESLPLETNDCLVIYEEAGAVYEFLQRVYLMRNLSGPPIQILLPQCAG